MKIAVIAHCYFPIKQPFAGGLEAHTDSLVRQLTAEGHEVTLYAKAGSKVDCNFVPIFAGNAKGGTSKLLRLAYQFACTLIQRGNFDLIFNNSLNAQPLIWHDSSMAPMITIFHTPPFPNIQKVLRAQSAHLNRTYIAVSELTASQWQPDCADKIQVVSNGIDTNDWPAHTAEPSSVRAIWTGRITPEKGTHLAVEAAIKADIPLTICGSVYDKDYFRATIKPHLKSGLITYAGHLNQSQISKLYSQSSVALVTPVWDEPFGYVAIEALSSGVPVAAFANGALPTIITSQVGALAKTETVDGLIAAMNQALRCQRDTCAEYVRQNYTIKTTVDAYLRLAPPCQPANERLQWQTNL